MKPIFNDFKLHTATIDGVTVVTLRHSLIPSISLEQIVVNGLNVNDVIHSMYKQIYEGAFEKAETIIDEHTIRSVASCDDNGWFILNGVGMKIYQSDKAIM